MLNCKPGDLARIVGLHPRLALNDRIVKLANEPSFPMLGAPHWRLEQPIYSVPPFSAYNNISGERWAAGTPVVVAEIPDLHLRPIRGDGVTDDEVRELFTPALTEAREVSHG